MSRGLAGRFGGGGRLLAFVSAVVFVDSALFGVIAPLLPFYTDELGLSKTEAGVLVAAFPAGVFAGAFPAGALVARFGAKPTAIVGLALFAGASLVFGFANDIVLLDLARFLQGAGSAASWTAGLAWLSRESPPERRGERLGIAFSGALAGSLLGPALGAAARGIDPAIVFSLAAAVGVGLIAWSLRVPAPPASRDEGGWVSALRERALLPGAGAILMVGLLFGVVEVLVPLRFDALGAGGAVIGGAFALAALAEGVTGPMIGRLSDRIGPLRPVRWSLVAGIVLALVLPLPETAALLVVLCVVLGPVEGGMFVPGMKMLADGAEQAGLDQGYAFAIFNFTWALTTAAGSAGGGAIADASSDTVAYGAMAAVLLAAFAAAFGLSPGRGRGSSLPGTGRGRCSLRFVRSSVLVGVVLGSALLVPASSFGVVSCQYNGSSKHLEVFESSPTTIVRNGSAIQVNSGSNPVACSGGPTVTNTDAIIVFDSAPANFSYHVTIDLSGGPFAPGADNEGGSNDEIEIELQDVESAEFKGSSGADNWRFGSDGANLNGASEANFLTPGVDTDVTFLASTDRVRMDTGGSSDVVRGNGGLGAGTPLQIPMRIHGGVGNDQLTGGDMDDTIAFEGAISNDAGNDTVTGGAGADVIGSDAGNDTVDGGSGTDLLSYFNTPAGVTLDLAVPGQQNTGGGGLDTVSGIESVDGSQFADTLLGDGGANLLSGHTGGDTLDGRAGVDVLDGDGLGGFGADILNVRDGGPDTATCGPQADTVSADVQGVDTIAADCETVDFAPFVQPPDDGGGGGGDGGGPGSGSVVDVSIKAKKKQDIVDRGALTVRTGCPAVDCEAKVTGAIRLPKGGGKSARAARKVKLRPVSESLAAGAPEKLKLILPRKGEKRVVRAMTTRSRLPALVTVDVTDGNGNQGTASAKVKVVD